MEPTGGNVQNILLGLGAIGGVVWAVYEKLTRHRVESANADSGVAMATANEALFNMLTNRLEALEAEVKQLRQELNKEREYTRLLVSTMMQAGIQPPAYPA